MVPLSYTSGFKTSPYQAAMINGAAAHVGSSGSGLTVYTIIQTTTAAAKMRGQDELLDD
jgi:hypothetical protein